MALFRACQRLLPLTQTSPFSCSVVQKFTSLLDTPGPSAGGITIADIEAANEELAAWAVHSQVEVEEAQQLHTTNSSCVRRQEQQQQSQQQSVDAPASSGSEAGRHGDFDGAKLTHVDGRGRANMVDVSQKAVTARTAVASATVQLFGLLPLDQQQGAGLGPPQSHLVCQLAGIRAAKMTSALIPLCHNINISKVGIELQPNEARNEVVVTATASAVGQTGVEMEALCAVSFAAINLLGSMGAVRPGGGQIRDIQLEEKSGGKSGTYVRRCLGTASASTAQEVQPEHQAVMQAETRSNNSSSSSGVMTSASNLGGEQHLRHGQQQQQQQQQQQAGRNMRTPVAKSQTASLADLLLSVDAQTKESPRPQGATAVARMSMPAATWHRLIDNVNKKGDVLAVARLAGIMAASQAGVLLPVCGPANDPRLMVDISLVPTQEGRLVVTAHAASHGVNSVDAAALTAATVSALTVYDMCKASSKSTVIEDIMLV